MGVMVEAQDDHAEGAQDDHAEPEVAQEVEVDGSDTIDLTDSPRPSIRSLDPLQCPVCLDLLRGLPDWKEVVSPGWCPPPAATYSATPAWPLHSGEFGIAPHVGGRQSLVMPSRFSCNFLSKFPSQ